MKILVPVDIYDSFHAPYEYAIHLAKSFNARITIIHVIQSVFNNNEFDGYSPYEEMEEAARIRLQRFVSEYKDISGEKLQDLKTNIEICFGIPGQGITDFAEDNDFDLIIMGVRDRHSFLDKILGSTSTETISGAKCPVMLIHQGYKFKKPEKILFAFDQKNDLDGVLEEYKKINNTLKAKTDFLHINIDYINDISKQKSEIVNELFEKENPQFAFEVKSINSNKVLSGISEYCHNNNIDVVAMIHRKGGIFANFLTRDKSIEMAHKFHFPVLAFKEN